MIIRKMNNESKSPDIKVLISSCTGIGNMVLKTPFINSIIKNFDKVQLDLVVGFRDKSEFIFEDQGIIDERVTLISQKDFFGKIRFCLNIRRKKYEYIFLPFDDEMSLSVKLFLSIFSGAKIVTHYTLPRLTTPRALLIFLFYLLNPRVILVPFLPGRHEIDLNYDLLQSLKDYPIKRSYKTFVEYKCDEKILEQFSLSPNKYIVLQLSARSGAPTPKKWPLKNFIDLYNKINKEFPDIKIVTIGNSEDFETDVSEFIKACPEVINTAGKTSLKEVTSIMLYAAVSIVHDSGAMHLANAVSAKVIALYGPTDISRTGPLDENTKVLVSQNKSTNIMFNSSIGEEGVLDIFGEDFCMSDIAPELVLDEIRRFLS